MTHLRIELNNIQENVSSAVIEKLYEIASSGDLDASSNLAGNIHATGTYQHLIDSIRGIFPDLYITADSVYTWFEDPEVRRILSQQIGDGTGVTSTQVALYNGDMYKRVGSTQTWFFSGNTLILTFDELEQFINVTLLHEATFKGCTNLRSIKLPPNLTSVSQQCFTNCSNLNIDLILPSTVKETGLLAFKGTAIKSITFPLTGFVGVTYFSNGVHYLDLSNMSQLTNVYNTPPVTVLLAAGCPKLQSITLSDSTLAISFLNDTALETVICGQNSQLKEFNTVDSFGNGGGNQQAFTSCSSLLTIVNFPKENFTKIPSSAFSSCTNLDNVNKYIGHNVTSIGDNAFYNAGHNGDYVHIPTSVTSIGLYAFYGFTILKCPGFIFHSTSVPTTLGGSFIESYSTREDYTTKFYVPYSSVSAYKTNSVFADNPSSRTWRYADRVYGYKIYQYSSSTWNELANPTEAQIESASSNVVNSVPSSSATEGDLAFVIFNS